MQLKDVDPAGIGRLPTANPNVMEPQVFESLARGLATYTFLQPIIIVTENGQDLLVDGEHRCQAAIAIRSWSDAQLADACRVRSESAKHTVTPQEIRDEFQTVPAVVAKDRNHAELLRIAINKLRGELDLSEVGRQLVLLSEAGFETIDLELSGFASWEISALLDTTSQFDEHLDGADVSPPAPPKPKTYKLSFTFDTDVDRASAKAALEKLGAGDALQGLLASIEHAMDCPCSGNHAHH